MRNANLMSIIPNLCLKKSFSDKFEINVKKENYLLTEVLGYLMRY